LGCRISLPVYGEGWGGGYLGVWVRVRERQNGNLSGQNKDHPPVLSTKEGPDFSPEPLASQMGLSLTLSAGAHFGSFQAFSALRRLKFDSLPFLKGTKSLSVDVGIMDKQILTAFIRNNKPVPFVFTEPFHTARSQITFLLTAEALIVGAAVW